MAYQCQNFKDGQILTAECLNRMENGIEDACCSVKTVNGVKPDKTGNVDTGYLKTVLWEWAVSLHFTIKTLSLPIGGYDAIEIIYLQDCYDKKMASSGELPMPTGEYTYRCFLFSDSGTVTTTVDIASNGTLTFTLKDDELGTPWKIYGIKYANHIVQSDNVLDSVGFYVDKKIKVNGTDFDLVDAVGLNATGYIKVSAGDVIRLKNVTMPDVDGDSNRVFCYRSNKLEWRSFSVISTDTSHSPVFEDGNVVQFTVLESDIYGTTGYIRINAENIDKYSIITVNKEIE